MNSPIAPQDFKVPTSYEEAFTLWELGKSRHAIGDDLKYTLEKLGLGITVQEMEILVNALDPNRNGTIELEHLSLLLNKPVDAHDQNRELRNAFCMFDQDEDGFITAEELSFMLSELGEKFSIKEAQELIEKVDNDGDGKVNYFEFVELMKM